MRSVFGLARQRAPCGPAWRGQLVPPAVPRPRPNQPLQNRDDGCQAHAAFSSLCQICGPSTFCPAPPPHSTLCSPQRAQQCLCHFRSEQTRCAPPLSAESAPPSSSTQIPFSQSAHLLLAGPAQAVLQGRRQTAWLPLFVSPSQPRRPGLELENSAPVNSKLPTRRELPPAAPPNRTKPAPWPTSSLGTSHGFLRKILQLDCPRTESWLWPCERDLVLTALEQ
jgi:hypothetical protein